MAATTLWRKKGEAFFDSNGDPLAGGKLRYDRATTTTLLTTYSDAAGTTPNTQTDNRIILDAAGRLEEPIYIDDSFDAKETLFTSADVIVDPWPFDNIPKAVDLTASLSDFAKPTTEWSTDSSATVNLTAGDAGKGRLADTSSNSITYNLPSSSAAGNGRGFTIKPTSLANNVILDGDGSETIDGQSTLTIRGLLPVKVTSDGANWRIEAANQVYAGSIVAWPTGTAPAGWLECDGSAVSRTTYAALFAVISDDYGNGDGSTTFNLPDLRGEFIRGFDNGAGNDPNAATRTDRGDGTTGDNVGTKQAGEFGEHGHPARISDGGSDFVNTTGGLALSTASPTNHSAFTGTLSNTPGEQITASGGDETRPRNVAMMWIIKA